MKTVLYLLKPILMKRLLLFTLLFSSFFTISAQDVERIEISGKIVVDSNDLEGITVYNSSSNKGTVTDENGKFLLNVALNDIVEFRALQFQDFTVTIDENIIKSKKMTVFLVEKVNKLDEVVILPYDLTGNLAVDIESVRTFNPNMDAIYFGIQNFSDYEFPDDYKSKVENIAMRGPGNDIRYQADAIAIIGMLLKPLFKSDKSKKENVKDKVPDIPTSGLRDYYSSQYILTNFEIPKDKIDEFIAFVENNGLDYNLLKAGKEMQFLEFLTQKSKQFLESLDGKH